MCWRVDVAPVTDVATPRPTSPPSGPMTRARVKALHDEVNSLLTTLDLGTPLDGLLPHADVLCVIRYKEHQGHREEDTPWSRGRRGAAGQEDGHGAGHGSRPKSARKRRRTAGPGPGQTGPLTGPPGPQARSDRPPDRPARSATGIALVTSGRHPGDLEPRPVAARSHRTRSGTGPARSQARSDRPPDRPDDDLSYIFGPNCTFSAHAGLV